MSLVFPRYRVGPLYHLRVVWSPSRVKRPTSVGFFTSVARLSGLSGLVMPELVFPLCSLLCEKMCPPWGLGKDYTQQFWIHCGLSRMSSYWRRPANSLPVFPDCQNVFLNNCRVVSASLMKCNLDKSNYMINIKIRKNEQKGRDKHYFIDIKGIIFVFWLAAILQIDD